MMYIISVIFVATKIPYMFGQYTRTYGFKKVNVDAFKFLNDTMPIATVITYTNFVVNFFIYYHYMEAFRDKFKQIFCCKTPEIRSQMSTRISTSVSSVSKSVDTNLSHINLNITA